MNKRFGALALVATSFPLLAATASPALAQEAGNSGGPPCGNSYNNGQPFRQAVGNEGPRVSSSIVKRGAEVVFSTTIVRNNTRTRAAEKCANRPARFTATGTGYTTVLREPNAREARVGVTSVNGRLVDSAGAFVFAGQRINLRNGRAVGISKRSAKEFLDSTDTTNASGIASRALDTTFVANNTRIVWSVTAEDETRTGRSVRVTAP